MIAIPPANGLRLGLNPHQAWLRGRQIRVPEGRLHSPARPSVPSLLAVQGVLHTEGPLPSPRIVACSDSDQR